MVKEHAWGTERRGVLQWGYAAEKQLNNTERLAV